MNEDEFAELAAGAALDALSAEDAARFRDALAAHPEWAEHAAADAQMAALLADAVAPVAPPASIRADLLAQISTTPQHAEPVPIARPRSWARIAFALAACLALLVGAGVGAAALNSYLNRPASVIALEEIQAAGDAEAATVQLDDGGTATAHWSASLGTAVLETDGIAAPAAGKTYELWFVRGETPISAGIFAVADGKATAALNGEMHAGDVIAVTVEPAGGSPTGTPSSDPVIVIPTA